MGFIELKCPNCGESIQLNDSKDVGFCSYCGTRVIQDKVIIQHTGKVMLDNEDELNKLFMAARNAREVSDHAAALRYYETITSKDPNSWEALFYTVMLKTESIKNGEIGSSAYAVGNCLKKVFSLIKENISDPDEQKNAVKEVCSTALIKAVGLTEASHSFYKALTKGNGTLALTGISGIAMSLKSTGEALQGDKERCAATAAIAVMCGNEIEKQFGMEEETYRNCALTCWKQLLDFDADYKKTHGSYLLNDETKREYSEKIRNYEPTSATAGVQTTRNTYGGNPASAAPAERSQPPVSGARDTAKSGSTVSIVFGVLGIVMAWLFALFGYIFGGAGLAIAIAAKNKEPGDSKAKIGLILSIVALVCSLVSSIIGILMTM